MKKTLVIAAVADGATGLALLIVPSLVGHLLLGAELNGVAIPVARVTGIALIALGIACWPGPPLLGMLTYSALVALYLSYLGVAVGLTGVFLWPAIALHVVLSFLLGRAWLTTPIGAPVFSPLGPSAPQQRGRREGVWTLRPMADEGYLQRFLSYFAIAGMVVILLGASVFIVETLPPRTVVMATGAQGGAYYEVGIRYREILAQSGVDLQLMPTDGALDNLKRLGDPQSGVSVGFIQGGTTTKKESPGIESLGTVFYEPLWFFSRIGGSRAEGLAGGRISVGPEGSGTRSLALKLLERNKIVAEFFALTPKVAAEKLNAGDIDVAFIVASWDAPVVQRLITAEGIELRSFPRADAYIGLYPFLNRLVLPEGVGDPAMNRPPSDVVLVAPKASLAVRADLHPAIQYLLLDAAVQVHSGPGIFQKAAQFPAAESIDIPLSAEAQRFYKSGRPFLQDYLPFWIATLSGRLIVVLLPLAALLYPILRFLPQLYGWIMRLKITRLYDEMRSIERNMEAHGQDHDAGTMIAKLDQLDQRANHLRLPAAYASRIYELRAHIDLVRERLATSPDQKTLHRDER